MTRRYMDVNDVAEYLGFKVSYVRKLLFRVSDIDAIIERAYVPQINEI